MADDGGADADESDFINATNLLTQLSEITGKSHKSLFPFLNTLGILRTSAGTPLPENHVTFKSEELAPVQQSYS